MDEKETKKKRGRPRKKGSTIEFKPISRKTLTLLHAVCRDDLERLILYILTETGIRVSDLCSISFHNVHKDAIEKPYIKYISTKTKKEVKAAISDETFELINKWQNIRQTDSILINDSRIIPYTTQWIRKILKKLRKRAKIKRPIRPHDFCETTMTLMGKKGYDSGKVAQQVGRDPITVQRHYQKYSIEDKSQMVKDSVSLTAILRDIQEEEEENG